MPFSQSDLIAMQSRLNRGKVVVESGHEPDAKEIGKFGLQQKIIDWCESQWPKWVYDFPRTDLKSTLPEGRHDATIWGPYPKCFLIETKAKGKKRSMAQQIWETRLCALGWQVHLVYSLEQFLEITSNRREQ